MALYEVAKTNNNPFYFLGSFGMSGIISTYKRPRESIFLHVFLPIALFHFLVVFSRIVKCINYEA